MSDNDKARHFCGLMGLYGAEDAAVKVYMGLYSLQHRGQESAGIVVSDGKSIQSHKGPGLVGDVFQKGVFDKLPGHLAIGHVRYSTTGSGRIQNIQPLVVELMDGLLAVGHNGNLVNARQLREHFQQRGAIFQTSTDSEIIVHMLSDPEYRRSPSPLAKGLSQLQGAFCFLFLTKDKLIAARDPWGFRPLCLGKLGEAWVVCSETCALDLIRAEYVRDVEPGEIVIIDAHGLHSEHFGHNDNGHVSQCIFEHVYFARPDSNIFGENVHHVRRLLGRRLAEEHPADADLVIAVPDSGRSAAMGYAEASGLPLERGFVRNHYVGRTFIMPGQESRTAGVDIKLNAIKDVVDGKRLVVVDDSIIRGTTSRGRLELLRRAGAREIHLRISCPPTRHPCFYGIDFQTQRGLIAAGREVDEICRMLELDSLGYLSHDGLLSGVAE
ncbi:MAG: amidophosphoribosyltransferase, partial [Planctomycetota bacterium]